MTPRALVAVAGTTVCVFITGPPLAAQATGYLDLGGSVVEYDGFLPSGAAYLNPTLRIDGRDFAVAAQGSYVFFESGNRVLQGSVAGAWLTPPRGRLRGEISGSAGLSGYENYPSYGHILARGRVHYAAGMLGAWGAAAVGRSYFGSASSPAYETAVGAWLVRSPLAASITLTRTWFADTAYGDVLAAVRLRPARFEITGAVGWRAWSRGGGRGAYGEGSVLVWLSSHVALVVSGGRYPSDPVRGVLPARYLSGGVRIAPFPGRRLPLPSISALIERSLATTAPNVHLEAIPWTEGLRRLRVHVHAVGSVELAGDITDWRPVPLIRVGDDLWQLDSPVSPGIYRVTIRVDGGEWLVPGGARREESEFGGVVGILLVR